MKKLLVLVCSLVSLTAFAGQSLVKGEPLIKGVDLHGSNLSTEQKKIAKELKEELEAIQKLDHSSKEYRERLNGWIDWANFKRKIILQKCGLDPEKFYNGLSKEDLEHHKRLWKSRGITMRIDDEKVCINAMALGCPTDKTLEVYSKEVADCGDDGLCKAQAQLSLGISNTACAIAEWGSVHIEQTTNITNNSCDCGCGK